MTDRSAPAQVADHPPIDDDHLAERGEGRGAVRQHGQDRRESRTRPAGRGYHAVRLGGHDQPSGLRPKLVTTRLPNAGPAVTAAWGSPGGYPAYAQDHDRGAITVAGGTDRPGDAERAPAHGFAIARLTAPGGDLGRIWQIPRPVIYRSITRLLDAGLLTQDAVESGRGPHGPSTRRPRKDAGWPLNGSTPRSSTSGTSAPTCYSNWPCWTAPGATPAICSAGSGPPWSPSPGPSRLSDPDGTGSTRRCSRGARPPPRPR